MKNIYKRSWGDRDDITTPVYWDKDTATVVSLDEHLFPYGNSISVENNYYSKNTKLKEHEIVTLVLQGKIKI